MADKDWDLDDIDAPKDLAIAQTWEDAIAAADANTHAQQKLLHKQQQKQSFPKPSMRDTNSQDFQPRTSHESVPMNIAPSQTPAPAPKQFGEASMYPSGVPGFTPANPYSSGATTVTQSCP